MLVRIFQLEGDLLDVLPHIMLFLLLIYLLHALTVILILDLLLLLLVRRTPLPLLLGILMGTEARLVNAHHQITNRQ